MKKIQILILATLMSISTFAQVGIGTATPDANSILDLTNGNNKVLIIPTTNSPSANIIGGVYFNTTDNTLNYHDGTSYNSLSAWKFNYNSSNYLYTNENVGIGITNPQTNLHIKGNGSLLSLEGSDHSFISFHPIGYSNGAKGSFGFHTAPSTHLALINKQTSGNVNIEFPNNTSAKLNVDGEINASGTNKIQENGNDLIPAGAIIMWSGISVPAGWALCNGTGSTPDLRGRFIVGSGGVYNTGATGGANDVTLTSAQMPVHNHNMTHNHSITDPGHNHTLRLDNDLGQGYIDDSGSDQRGSRNTGSSTTGVTINNFTGNTQDAGSSAAHENRPPYYALAFIIKL